MRKKIILLFFLFAGCGICSYAQMKPPVSIPSPNAATLGTFGEIPMTLFSGLPQVSIPLHTLTEGELQVPLSLSYHASGVRVDQHPGWVGLNWNLNAFGTITRKVNDVLDEFDLSMPFGIKAGYYFSYGLNSSVDWNTVSYIESLTKDNQSFKDTEPDEFSFNCFNISGSFYLDHMGKWQVRSQSKVKVIFSGTFLTAPFERLDMDNIRCFSGFTLIDESGTQYVFGGTTDAIEFSIPFYNQSNYFWTANSWYLTKIISPTNRQINFTYTSRTRTAHNGVRVRDEFINAMYISVNYKKYKGSGGGTIGFGCSHDDPLLPLSGIYAGSLIAPVYLEKIEASNELILFSHSFSNELAYDEPIYNRFYNDYLRNKYKQENEGLIRVRPLFPFLLNPDAQEDVYPQCLTKLQWRKLDQVEVFRKTDYTLPKRYLFTYNNVPTERLMLLNVQQQTSENDTLPAYHFSYNTQEPLPDYLSDHADHWGFYNGYKSYTYEQDVQAFRAYHAFREPDAVAMQSNILTQIVYPTGGKTVFEYEPHTYASCVAEVRSNPLLTYSSDQLAGGLRVRKIRSYTGQDSEPALEKEYLYVKNYTPSAPESSLRSSGVLGGLARYYWESYRTYANRDRNVQYEHEFFSTNSIMPGSHNAKGSHVGYSEVVEKRSDGSYTRFLYTNFDNGYMDEPLSVTLQPTRTIYDPYIDKSFERGELLSEEVYRADRKLLQKKEYSYGRLSNSFVRSINVSYFNACPGVNFTSVIEGYALKHYTYQFKPVSEKVYTYDSNSGKLLASTTSYSYNDIGQVKEVRTSLENGEQKLTRYQYVHDLSFSQVEAGKYCQQQASDAAKNLQACYDYMCANLPPNEQGMCRYYCEEEYDYDKVYYRCQATINPSEQTRTLMEMNALHILSPVVSETSYISESGTYKASASIWNEYRYVTGNYYSLARIRALSTDQLVTGLQLPEIIYPTGDLKVDLRYDHLLASYDYYDRHGNLLQYTTENGVSTTYLWGYNGLYPVAEIRNATYAQVKAALGITSQVDLGSGGLSAAQQKALQEKLPLGTLLTTYTYQPLVGMVTATDPNGRTTSYDYDSFLRLSSITGPDGEVVKRIFYHYKP